MPCSPTASGLCVDMGVTFGVHWVVGLLYWGWPVGGCSTVCSNPKHLSYAAGTRGGARERGRSKGGHEREGAARGATGGRAQQGGPREGGRSQGGGAGERGRRRGGGRGGRTQRRRTTGEGVGLPRSCVMRVMMDTGLRDQYAEMRSTSYTSAEVLLSNNFQNVTMFCLATHFQDVDPELYIATVLRG